MAGDLISRTNARYVQAALQLRDRLAHRLERLETRTWRSAACARLSETYRQQLSEVEAAVRHSRI